MKIQSIARTSGVKDLTNLMQTSLKVNLVINCDSHGNNKYLFNKKNVGGYKNGHT